jgi:hypothetical protein
LIRRNQLTVTRAGDRLFVRRTGKMNEEMFAESEHDYPTSAFDDQITFVSDTTRKVREVVYRENGKVLRAKRID